MHIVPTFQWARTGMEKRVVREKAEKNEATETVAALGVNKEQRAAVMFVLLGCFVQLRIQGRAFSSTLVWQARGPRAWKKTVDAPGYQTQGSGNIRFVECFCH